MKKYNEWLKERLEERLEESLSPQELPWNHLERRPYAKEVSVAEMWDHLKKGGSIRGLHSHKGWIIIKPLNNGYQVKEENSKKSATLMWSEWPSIDDNFITVQGLFRVQLLPPPLPS